MEVIDTDGHRFCYCGTFPELIGTMHTKECYVHCPNCGARSVSARSPFQAWIAWDNEELHQDEENFTLYDIMGKAGE